MTAGEIALCILSGSDNLVGSELLSQISGLFNEKNEDAKAKLVAEVLKYYYITLLSPYSFIIIIIVERCFGEVYWLRRQFNCC